MRFEKDKILELCTVRNAFAAAYVVLVFTILLIPSLGMKTKKELLIENRPAAQFPEISCRNYRNFAPQFEKYLSDRFQKRRQYVHVWNYLNLKLFRESPSEQIVLGKDGFIFLASHFAGKENENSLFEHLLKLDREVISQSASGLIGFKEVLQKAHTPILFVTVPTKHSLNYDKLPASIRWKFRDNDECIPVFTKITEELKKADPEYAEKYFLDLYPDAFAANKKMQLIPTKNFHWIPGPYTHLASHAIAKKFGVTQDEFVLDPENYVWCSTLSDLDFFFGFDLDNPAWNLSEKSNPARRLPFTGKYLLHDCPEAMSSMIYYSENPAAKGGRIMAIGDSFTTAVCQDLARYFSEVTAMDMAAMQRYSRQEAERVFREIVRTYRPEYVVVISHSGYILEDVIADAVNDPALSL